MSVAGDERDGGAFIEQGDSSQYLFFAAADFFGDFEGDAEFG